MTFKNMQDRVMARTNLTSTDARARIKDELNDRYRQVATAVNLSRTRRGNKDFVTVSGNNQVTATGVVKLLTLYDPTNLKRTLTEVSADEIRQKDPPATAVGPPREYAIYAQGASTITLLLYPKPMAIYTLKSDSILQGTDMAADGDVPTFEEDFHDVLIMGVMADELDRMEKFQAAATRMEARFEKRLGELRYFYVSSNYLKIQPTDVAVAMRPGKVWPYSNMI